MVVVTNVIPDKFGWRIKFSDRTSYFIDRFYCTKDELPKIDTPREEVTERWNPAHEAFYYGKSATHVTVYSRLRSYTPTKELIKFTQQDFTELGMVVGARYRELSNEKPITVRSETLQKYPCNAYPRSFVPEIDALIKQFRENFKTKEQETEKIKSTHVPKIMDECPTPEKRKRKRIPLKVTSSAESS